MSDIADLSACDLAAAIRNSRISPVEAVEAALGRIEARRDLNAFMAVPADRALAEAREAEAAVKRGERLGSLHGVPFSAKDLINTEGVETTQGSALFGWKYSRRGRRRRRAREGGGRHPDRQDDHAGIRPQSLYRGAVLRSDAQSLERGLHLRRIVRRSGRRRRRRNGAIGAGHRWRRIDPHSSLLLRRRRPQGDARDDPASSGRRTSSAPIPTSAPWRAPSLTRA